MYPTASSNSSSSIPTIRSARSSVSPARPSSALTNTGLVDPESHRLEEIDACSAECEVNIAQEWLEKLPPRSYDEQYVLKRNARPKVLNKHSRLSCQVVLTLELQGMVVDVPEPKPCDIH